MKHEYVNSLSQQIIRFIRFLSCFFYRLLTAHPQIFRLEPDGISRISSGHFLFIHTMPYILNSSSNWPLHSLSLIFQDFNHSFSSYSTMAFFTVWSFILYLPWYILKHLGFTKTQLCFNLYTYCSLKFKLLSQDLDESIFCCWGQTPPTK